MYISPFSLWIVHSFGNDFCGMLIYNIPCKKVERVSKKAVDALDSKDIILEIIKQSRYWKLLDREQYSRSLYSKICCVMSGRFGKRKGWYYWGTWEHLAFQLATAMWEIRCKRLLMSLGFWKWSFIEFGTSVLHKSWNWVVVILNQSSEIPTMHRLIW